MKKTTQIHLAGSLFYIEEHAYAILEGYLDSIKKHFEHNPDSEEILSDIESRIAEKLRESDVKVVTTKHVEDIIASIGTVEELSGEENMSDTPHSSGSTSHKRLYRNTDDAIIAGVASGLGYYFGIDPFVIRLLFIIVTLAGGSGILIYIVLWFAIPEAVTASQKLEMRGEKVTLSNVKDMIKEKVEEVKNRADKTAVRKHSNAFRAFLEGIVTFLKKGIFPIIRMMIGFIITICSFIAGVGITIVAGIVIFNVPTAIIDPVVAALAHGPLFYAALLGFYFALIVPTFIMFIIGLGLIRGKRVFGRNVVLIFAAIWFVALVLVGVIGSRLALRAREIISTDPAFATQTQVVALAPFSKISVQNSKNITYVAGKTYSVAIEGTGYTIGNLKTDVNNDTLTISSKDEFRICIFCHSQPVAITVTAPQISDVTLQNASSFTGPLSGDHVNLSLGNDSRAEATLSAKSASISEGNASRATLSGTASSFDLKLSNDSSLVAHSLAADTVTATLENASRASVSASSSLSVKARNGSTLLYSGAPTITQDLQNGSHLKKDTTLY